MNKTSNTLLIVEGSKTEPSIFLEVFKKYGFSVKNETKLSIDDIGQFDRYEFDNSKDNIIIVEGPRNRIHDLLLLINDPMISIERVFNSAYAHFQRIFLIYDVDHNDCDDIEQMMKRFSDESSGMLLLSSPCIEVIADFNRNRSECKYHHPKEYKSEINEFYNGQTMKYIHDNFEKLMLYFLKKNFTDFNESNVMEHPHLVAKQINKENERYNSKHDSYVIYRYFTTVIYVAIACANHLTKQIDNYKDVIRFFELKCAENN